MYTIKKVAFFDIVKQLKVNKILYDCGKYMAKKYDLHHWDNSHFKNFIIVLLCEIKNNVYLIYEDGKAIATFQTKRVKEVLKFEKLATSPNCMAKGIGTYCLKVIEQQANDLGCKKINMEVYSSSQHAIDFYLHRGYVVTSKTKTLKYSEIIMEKILH